MASAENPDGLLNDVLFLIFDIFLYTCFLTIIELGYFDKLSNFIVHRMLYHYVPVDSSSIDTDVKQERDFVQSPSAFRTSCKYFIFVRRRNSGGRFRS